MGLIKAALGSADGVLADQWKEFFYCESLPDNVLVAKGQKRTSKRSSNTKGTDNIITNGSVIVVAVSQCMIIVEQGKVVDLCAEPGEYTYDTSTEPSIFAGGDLAQNIKDVFKNVGKRFTFGGEAPKDQRIYYFNTKEIMGNKYGTPNPVPFKVVDEDIGFKTNIGLRCFGEYSYRITNPLLFYTNVCGNVEDEFDRSKIDSQLKTELLTALGPAFATLSRVDYTALPAHTMEIADALNDVLSAKWRDRRGLEIVEFGISSVKASEEDEARIQKMQDAAFIGGGNVMAGTMASATADSMRDAANNQGGAAMAFMGMNMAQGMGMNNMNGMAQMMPQQNVYQQQAAANAAPAASAAPAGDTWDCACGKKGISGKFCPECGTKKPEPKPAGDTWDCSCGKKGISGKFCPECGAKKPVAAVDGWVCASCGTVNKGKFCLECGAKKPAAVPQYRCDKCGWEPADKAHPPKFCPECGDPFDDGDLV